MKAVECRYPKLRNDLHLQTKLILAHLKSHNSIIQRKADISDRERKQINGLHEALHGFAGWRKLCNEHNNRNACVAKCSLLDCKEDVDLLKRKKRKHLNSTTLIYLEEYLNRQ